MASETSKQLDHFLRSMRLDLETIETLSHQFLSTFRRLSAESPDQFLPTPISESILRPVGQRGHGRSVRDNDLTSSGGTNLRVGFVELLGREASQKPPGSLDNASGQIHRHLERSWPIADQLKSDNADSLFRWIGQCIAEVVKDGCDALDLSAREPLPLGVTFSFPAEQPSLSEATLTSMGKGFAIESKTNLGLRLQEGYMQARGNDQLPPIQVTAIANDSVATLISFIFKYGETSRRRAAMGLILGTGCNATIPLKLRSLNVSKRPANVTLLPGESMKHVRIAVNTEWGIKGTAKPLREMNIITLWDDVLSTHTEIPGFQPLEYMTAGRYLGELGRIMLVDYMISVVKVKMRTLPARLLQSYGLTTTFLSHFRPLQPSALLSSLRKEFPESTGGPEFAWTEDHAQVLYHMAKAIEVRAAGIIAAATMALLTLAEEIPSGSPTTDGREPKEIAVGYTGGCIVHFQDYLVDCQHYLDELMKKRFGEGSGLRVVLSPCHDGGITGAGILVATASASKARDLA